MIDKNMMRIILVLAICFLVGCASNENVVSIEQVESTNSVVLRMKKDKNSIFSLSYPLSFKDKENNSLTSSYKIFNDSTSYIIDKNDTIKERMSVYYKKMMDEKKDTIHVPLKEFNSNFRYIIDNFFEGDSIYLHFHDHKRWHDIPLRVSFD